MDSLFLIAPILIPLASGIIAFLLPKSRAWQASFGILASLALVAASVRLFTMVDDGTIVKLTMSNWPAPFGIVFVSDILSAAMVVVTAIMGLATSLYMYADIDALRFRYGFVSMLQFLQVGICGAFLTGDIFNLYVWYEVMLITSFALLSMGGHRMQIYGTIKYLGLNLIATVLLLTAIALLYGATGTLNMADLSRTVPQIDDPVLLNLIAVFFIVAFGIKSAVFPLFFWLPASYHLPTVSVSAIFAGMLTKVGVYSLVRVFTLIFTTDVDFTHSILLWISGFTMVSGVLGAAIQMNVRRILSFHIISQIGYMVMGLALFSAHAVAGTVFYIIHHILVKANLFFMSGVIRYHTGSFALPRIGGLYVAAPVVSILFLIPAFSLAGFPPLSGFWAKLLLIQAGLQLENGWIVAAALFTGLFTIYSMTKIWGEAFWKAHPDEALQAEKGNIPMTSLEYASLLAPGFLLGSMTMTIGLYPEYFLQIAQSSAEQLMNPSVYVDAVLGAVTEGAQ